MALKFKLTCNQNKDPTVYTTFLCLGNKFSKKRIKELH